MIKASKFASNSNGLLHHNPEGGIKIPMNYYYISLTIQKPTQWNTTIIKLLINATFWVAWMGF